MSVNISKTPKTETGIDRQGLCTLWTKENNKFDVNSDHKSNQS